MLKATKQDDKGAQFSYFSRSFQQQSVFLNRSITKKKRLRGSGGEIYNRLSRRCSDGRASRNSLKRALDFIARFIFPVTFKRPVMKAWAGVSLPAQTRSKASSEISRVASTC